MYFLPTNQQIITYSKPTRETEEKGAMCLNLAIKTLRRRW